MQYATKGTGSVLPVWSTATSFLARWLVAVSVPAVNGKRGLWDWSCTSLSHYNPLSVQVSGQSHHLLLVFVLLKVLRRWASGDGDRRSMPLAVFSHKPARRRCESDGRSSLTLGVYDVRILLARQSSPI